MTVKAPVRAIAMEPVADLSTLGAGSVLDGVTLAAGDRVLLAAQTDAIENGMYVIADAGTAPERAPDLPVGSGACGTYAFVDEGTMYVDRSFVCVSNVGADVVGTHPLEWVQFGARPTAYAGFGMKVGASNALDVDSTVIPVLAGAQTFTGANSFSAAVTVAADLAVTGDVHSVTAPRVTGLLTANVGLDPSDAVNVEYLDSRLSDMGNNTTTKLPVRCASTGPANLATLTAGATVDGIVLVANDRVLLVHQTDAKENGVYVVAAAGAATRAPDMGVGLRVHGAVVTVVKGALYGARQLMCTSPNGLDTVGSHNLLFVAVSHSVEALAGPALEADPGLLRLAVRVDGATLEIDPEVSANHVRVRDGGITNAQIADATVANAKLVNAAVQVKVGYGLLRTSTDGVTTSPAVGDTASPSDYGTAVALGGNIGLELDKSVVPDLSVDNVFAGNNTFSGTNTFNQQVHVTVPPIKAYQARSRTTGALVVSGGVGVTGDVFCDSVYSLSDARLKDNVVPLPNALDCVRQMRGCTYTWNARAGEGLRGTDAVGLIAQEVRAVAPLCVTHDPATDLLAVDYPKCVAYLVEAIKTLDARCAALEAALLIQKQM